MSTHAERELEELRTGLDSLLSAARDEHGQGWVSVADLSRHLATASAATLDSDDETSTPPDEHRHSTHRPDHR